MANNRSAAAPSLLDRFLAARALTAALAAPLSDADATIQPHPDASPAKWHLAHTSWFLETFVLRDHVAGYRLRDDRWPFLFNSYYDGEGARHARARRGMISRPSLAEIMDYRARVEDAVARALPDLPDDARELVALGVQHEQQHQELLLADILAAFAENPLAPAYWPVRAAPASTPTPTPTPTPAPDPRPAAPLGWLPGRAGVVEVGAPDRGFAFDSERPRHAVLLHPHAIADRPVTNAEWRAFIADGGYRNPGCWLSDGWAWRMREAAEAPLYWRGDDAAFGLAGLAPLDPSAPVVHVGFYEADAYARWAGARLPTEAEWEAAAADLDPHAGNQLDAPGPIAPRASAPGGMFGDVWEWTASAFHAYPGFRPAEGTVGEYNGKFMSGQQVLRGGSCATPRGHLRASYRNFFPPSARWQFSGVRLARDA